MIRIRLIMQDELLPPLLRMRFCHLIESLYVDIDGNVDIMAEVELCIQYDILTRHITPVRLSSPRIIPLFQCGQWWCDFIGVRTRMVRSARWA
jgi:hypothetical protein